MIVIPSKGQLSGVWLNCETCGKITYKTPYQYKTKKHHFCSHECSSKYNTLQHTKEVKCEFCGRFFIKRNSNPQRFCSVSCQNEWQKTVVGEKNPRYTRITHKCDYCGKEHIVKAYKANNKNLFCSAECRQAWYASIWSQREEWRMASARRAVKTLSDGLISHTKTLPQIMVDKALDELGIDYCREYPVAQYSVDNYLTKYGLFIEVMGDFWHTSPLKYAEPKYDKQTKALKRDILKAKYIRENMECNILYLWESDIKSNIDLCKALIKLYIQNDGRLENYHSFNYFLDDSGISLNKRIVPAFQDYLDLDFLLLSPSA